MKYSRDYTRADERRYKYLLKVRRDFRDMPFDTRHVPKGMFATHTSLLQLGGVQVKYYEDKDLPWYKRYWTYQIIVTVTENIPELEHQRWIEAGTEVAIWTSTASSYRAAKYAARRLVDLAREWLYARDEFNDLSTRRSENQRKANAPRQIEEFM